MRWLYILTKVGAAAETTVITTMKYDVTSKCLQIETYIQAKDPADARRDVGIHRTCRTTMRLNSHTHGIEILRCALAPQCGLGGR